MGALLLTAACSPTPQTEASPSPRPSQILPPGVDEQDTAAAVDGPTEPVPLPTQEASLGDAVVFDTGITVEITAVEATEVEASTPGEVSGTAVTVTVTATNASRETQELASAVVTLVTGDGELGIGTTAGAPAPFTDAVEPGETREGTYVFMLAEPQGRDVTVSVNYAAGEPVAVFTGKVA